MASDFMVFSSSQLTFVWLGLFVILIVIELFTVGLTTIWFAAGALAGMAVNLMGAGLPVQIIVFLAVSCVLLVLTRPWAIKHLNQKRIRTNYESQIGKVILITEKVDNLAQTGKSVVDGQEWTVRCRNKKEVLEKGSLAKVVDVSGVKLMVERYEEDEK